MREANLYFVNISLENKIWEPEAFGAEQMKTNFCHMRTDFSSQWDFPYFSKKIQIYTREAKHFSAELQII